MNKISFEDTEIAFAHKNNSELLKTYWLFKLMNYPILVKPGTFFIKLSLNIGLPIKTIVKNTIFWQFCGGESIQDCEKTIEKLAKFNIGTILDYSVEGEKSEKNFDDTTEETIKTIIKAHNNPNIPFSVFKVTGVADADIMTKIQKGELLTEEESKVWNRAVNRVNKICKTAHENDVRIFIDAEESWFQDTIDKLCYEMMAKYNKEKAIVYNTYQLYRHDRLTALKYAMHDAIGGLYFIGAKLVRGAYMEKERKYAAENGLVDPINPSKEASDELYNKALVYCLDNLQRISICAGTHNEYSSDFLTILMDKYNVAPNDKRIFFAQLYGMSDHISYNLAKAGYNVAKYVPYGPVESVMPYLFRRADENTSVKGQSSREYKLVAGEKKRRG
jgi:proline dehydrogenase